MASVRILGLDVGDKRIGLAIGDSIGRIATPLTTIVVDGAELNELRQIIQTEGVERLVVGLPRNASGEETQQSQKVRRFVSEQLLALGLPVHFQDESLTSIIATDHLMRRRKQFKRAAVDAEAAAIILQDYLEEAYARRV